MENIITILQLLYKRVSSENVIDGRIWYSNFGQSDFLNIATAYVHDRSENEMANLFNYLISICCQEADREGRRIDRQLNVFEMLFYVSVRFLDITNNNIRCRYEKLPQWRKLTVELSEDLLVTAFLARKLTHESVMRRGFTWPRIIGHDNEHLHAVMKRGISENHSHINGAAPIFHISWISLMNNVSDGRFKQRLMNYDSRRRYTNVLYSAEYGERSFHVRHLQAALIRLLLFSKVSGIRMRLGNYRVKIGDVAEYLSLPRLLGLGNDDIYINGDIIGHIKKELKERDLWSYREILRLFLKAWLAMKNGGLTEDNVEEFPDVESPACVFFDRSPLGSKCFKREVLSESLGDFLGRRVSDYLMDLLILIGSTELDNLEGLFASHADYKIQWEIKTLHNVQKMLTSPYTIDMELKRIQSVIDVMRREARRNVSAMYGSTDYALTMLTRDQMKEEDPNFIFAGERWLLYSLFEEIHLQHMNFDPQYINLFYAYLLIKESLRSEMIQSNANVGFANFGHYQSRKSDFLADQVYQNVFIRTAVHESLISPNIRHMELRMSPSSTVESNFRKILQYDRTIGMEGPPENPVQERFFYTLHFIKRTEDLKKTVDYFYCRNYYRRCYVMQMARAIAGVREQYPLVGERIFGIDAASNEIGCRPEVFSTAFRYLKAHRYVYRTCDGPKKLPQLRATYHVGEDFLDVADGLRAIDEAVNFLNLGYGDRLGHAIALGIDVKRWYENKNYKIMLPCQDYLDNLVWVYQKLSEYGIAGYENLRQWIYTEFTVIFERLYGGLKDPLRADMYNYYNAWKLRGDDPSLYEDGTFNRNVADSVRQPYLINELYPEQYHLRELPEVTQLYFRYHFDEKSRRLGAVTSEYTVSKAYANAVGEIQVAMQKVIASKGLAIETNPSSNYHIGTFQSYEDHPIVHFFNKGLVHDVEKLKACPQIPVSINTDDQGVFNTSLENEYALMAAALEAVTDDHDQKVYSPSDIYEWLDRIRIMGNDQNFAQINAKSDPGNIQK